MDSKYSHNLSLLVAKAFQSSRSIAERRRCTPLVVPMSIRRKTRPSHLLPRQVFIVLQNENLFSRYCRRVTKTNTNYRNPDQVAGSNMSSNDGKLINPIPSQYLDFLAPQYIALYNEHHGMCRSILILVLADTSPHLASKLRADQVDIAQVRSNPRYYGSGVGSVTDIIVGKVEYHDIAVKNPDGSIKVAVYTPTLTVVAKGRMRNKHGLPAHINFHGGKFNPPLVKEVSRC